MKVRWSSPFGTTEYDSQFAPSSAPIQWPWPRPDVQVGDSFQGGDERWVITAIDYSTGKVTTGRANPKQ